jgi:hypothetical protein
LGHASDRDPQLIHRFLAVLARPTGSYTLPVNNDRRHSPHLSTVQIRMLGDRFRQLQCLAIVPISLEAPMNEY